MDNWKHRSKGMLCNSCIWFVLKVRDKGPVDSTNNTLGRCRKRCPSDKGWVPVFNIDWCGDHRLGENKIINDKAIEGALTPHS